VDSDGPHLEFRAGSNVVDLVCFFVHCLVLGNGWRGMPSPFLLFSRTEFHT